MGDAEVSSEPDHGAPGRVRGAKRFRPRTRPWMMRGTDIPWLWTMSVPGNGVIGNPELPPLTLVHKRTFVQ